MTETYSIPKTQKKTMRDWTQGSITRNIVLLSWPLFISMIINTMGPTLDMIWVSRLGTSSIASVGMAGVAVMLLNSIMMFPSMGLQAMVARFIGAGDEEGASQTLQQTIAVSIAISLVFITAGIVFAVHLLRMTGADENVVTQGAAYLRIQFIGSLVNLFCMIFMNTMQCSGDTVTPMKVNILIRVIDVILAPVLVFGWWIFPRMEVAGAALAQVIAQTCGACVALWLLSNGKTRVRLTFRNFHIRPDIIWRLLKIGVPASLGGIQMAIGNIIWITIVASFGTAVIAAHTVSQTVDMFLTAPIMSIGMAAGVLTAQNLGAQKPDRAAKTGWTAVFIVECFMVLAGIIIGIWAEDIAGFFNTDPDVINLIAVFMRITASGYLLFGFAMILQICVQNVGDTVPPMIVSIVTMWCVQIPLALLLPKIGNLDMYGLRWAMVSSTVVQAIFFIIYFRLGRWKKKKV